MPKPTLQEQLVAEIDVLRAHAIAAALRRARPADYLTNRIAREAWYDCVRHCETVVCSARGVSIVAFHNLCGLPD